MPASETELWALIFGEEEVTPTESAVTATLPQTIIEAKSIPVETRQHSPIPGLVHVKRFMAATAEAELLSQIQQGGFFEAPESNQAMLFGQLPSWALQLADTIQTSGVLPLEVTHATLELTKLYVQKPSVMSDTMQRRLVSAGHFTPL